MGIRSAALRTVELPDFGAATAMPVLSRHHYDRRVDAAMARMLAAGLDALAVYGDREHSANIAYLSGYDPRFEEALLLIAPGRTPKLLVGNEGWGYAELCAGPYERVLYQTFSLPGQPRGHSASFPDILAEAGVKPGDRIGAVGWKMFSAGDADLTATSLDLPSFLADALRSFVGERGEVVHAAGLLMNPADGLRAINEAAQLAAFEFAATHTSRGVRRVLAEAGPGMTELQAASLLGMHGLPHNCHPMLSAGPRAAYGLPSPSTRVMQRGDPITVAYGVHGALSARAGFLVEDAGELPTAIRDYVDKLVEPYFCAIVDWYKALAIGATGGALWQAVHNRIGDPFFGVSLNPGHLIHLDEWMHSPVERGSDIRLQSGMALQVDVIPATGTPYHTTNIEDGVALADAALRDEFSAAYPEAWSRIGARRAFMIDTLGIRLAPEVLPFSSIPAYLPPFWLARDKAMVVAAR